MENKYISDKYLGENWDILKVSSLFKEKIRKVYAEKEIIDGYMNALEVVYKELKKQNNPSQGLKPFCLNQMCLPFLYLCRHTIELCMKNFLEYNKITFEQNHSLKKIWKLIQDNIQADLKGYNELIMTFNELDRDGSRLRYVKDKNGEEYTTKPIFINSSSIYAKTKELCNYLNNKLNYNEES